MDQPKGRDHPRDVSVITWIFTLFVLGSEFGGPVWRSLGNTWGQEQRRVLNSYPPKQVILDYGWTPAALMNNLKVLGVNTDRVEALVVSHGHADHFSGLVEFLKERRSAMRPDLPLYIGGDDAFCQHWIVGPGGKRVNFGTLDRAGIEAAGVKIVVAEKGAVLRYLIGTRGRAGLASSGPCGCAVATLWTAWARRKTCASLICLSTVPKVVIA